MTGQGEEEVSSLRMDHAIGQSQNTWIRHASEVACRDGIPILRGAGGAHPHRQGWVDCHDPRSWDTIMEEAPQGFLESESESKSIEPRSGGFRNTLVPSFVVSPGCGAPLTRARRTRVFLACPSPPTDMVSMAEENIMRFLKLKLTEEQANKFSAAEILFLIDNAFDDIDALKGATLSQLVAPPGDQGCIWILLNPSLMPNTSGGQGGLRVGIR